MSFLGELISTIFERRYQKNLADEVEKRTTPELISELLGSHGEVSGLTLSRALLERFADMGTEHKAEFFTFLATQLEIDHDEVIGALNAYKDHPSKDTYQAYASACEPRRQELARRLNQVPGATGQLVAMRDDLLSMLDSRPELGPLDVDFRHLFSSWFNRGFLVLKPINWRSPAEILEKIIAYEAVHAIDSWDDLRRRVQPSDRRCFGFFHPAMANEPLIFVEVALTQGIPDSIQNLLADERTSIDAEDADTAVFYSISNCQAGLAGISFGNSLIKQVVSDLSKDLPALDKFVTLSPIPKLNQWMSDRDLLVPDKNAVQALAAYYLMEAKSHDGMPFDPVARFHLGNGALIHAVHANADLSQNGKKQSNGAMVNYLYDRSQIANNHERFIGERFIAATDSVKNLSAAVKDNSVED